MRKFFIGLSTAAGLALLSSAAYAVPAISTDAVTLRAGPGTEYPEVGTIAADDPVEVIGCIDGYDWCDVVWEGARGWIPGNDLAYLEDGTRVVFVEAAPRISVPIVSFSIGTYWREYYNDRPFYTEIERYGGPDVDVEVNIDNRDQPAGGTSGAATQGTAAPVEGRTTRQAPAEGGAATTDAPADSGAASTTDGGASGTDASSQPIIKKPVQSN